MASANLQRTGERAPTKSATIPTHTSWTTTLQRWNCVTKKVWHENRSGTVTHLIHFTASYHRASSSGRPLANPDLFKTNVQPPQSGPVDEVDAADRRMQRQASPGGSATKQAKWQPLTSVAPNPESEENDPFSLGDSDDEKESKTKDQRESDSARLKEAARNSISAEAGSAPAKELQASERSGSKNAEAEALLTGKS